MRDIIKEHKSEWEAWRKTCEERFDETLAQGCVPILEDHSWVRWDKPPPMEFGGPYDTWNMSTEFTRIMVKRQIEQQQAQLEACYKLLDAIADYAHEDAEFQANLLADIKRIKAMGE